MKEHNNCSEASKSLVYARQDSLNMKGEFRSFYLSKLLLFLRSDFESRILIGSKNIAIGNSRRIGNEVDILALALFYDNSW